MITYILLTPGYKADAQEVLLLGRQTEKSLGRSQDIHTSFPKRVFLLKDKFPFPSLHTLQPEDGQRWPNVPSHCARQPKLMQMLLPCTVVDCLRMVGDQVGREVSKASSET
jgi:hypothetical protein